MDKHVNKVMQFHTVLCDCYKDEDDRDGKFFPQIELSNDEITDDFIAMLEAQKILYEEITGDKQDLLGFTHILNRLAFQYILESREEMCNGMAD